MTTRRPNMDKQNKTWIEAQVIKDVAKDSSFQKLKRSFSKDPITFHKITVIAIGCKPPNCIVKHRQLNNNH